MIVNRFKPPRSRYAFRGVDNKNKPIKTKKEIKLPASAYNIFNTDKDR